MDLSSEKLDLINWLTQLTDEKIIQKIKALRNEKSEDIHLTEAHKKILDQRISKHHKNPKEGKTWNLAKERITSNK